MMSRKRPPISKDRRDPRQGPSRDPQRRDDRPAKGGPRPEGGAPRARPERKAEGKPERIVQPKLPSDVALIWGYHAVREALRSERRKILRIVATDAAAEKLAPEIAKKGLSVEIATIEQIAQRVPKDAVHQGLLIEARHLPDLDIEDLPDNGFILVLDQVTDPHNVGAILRTAAAFGLDAIVTTERHSPALTGVLAKTASGGLEHVPIVTVTNLARALENLGRRGYLRVGLDSEGPRSLEEETLSRPLALVLGAEGKGLRRLSRENCDVLARIDMPGPIKSLNVSNACAVALTIARMKLAQ